MTDIITHPAPPLIAFDNSFAREMEGFFVRWAPAPSPDPILLKLNGDLAQELGLDADALRSPAGVTLLAGNAVPAGAQPVAQVYAGHQFGGFSPLLGDGRALLLGEVIDRHGQRRDIAFKGSGRTPFGRRGDGKAAVGPVLREYLMGEAMHALGIPTTRALAAVRTGESIWRQGSLPGALLTRVAASHVRVGTFQYFAAQDEQQQVRKLADYVIARHAPSVSTEEMPYLALLRHVADRQAALIAQWMGVGFIHGVMNTDNMALSGETIDYGPCAFMEHYDPDTVFSSIDEHGRYAYGNQPAIAHWNLARFAETLLSLVHETPSTAIHMASEVIADFPARYQRCWLDVLRTKLGLCTNAADDETLGSDFLRLLQEHQVDFTLGFRRLVDAQSGNESLLLALFPQSEASTGIRQWLTRWRARLATDNQALAERHAMMKRANPIYIPRNHLVEEALAAAVDSNDMEPFDRLLQVVQQPFDERPLDERYAIPAPREQTACYKTFCGT